MSRLGKTHFRLVPIQKIKRRPCNKSVYNLAVEEDESYVANDIVVHNCRSTLIYLTVDDAPIEFSSDAEIDRAVALVQDGFA